MVVGNISSGTSRRVAFDRWPSVSCPYGISSEIQPPECFELLVPHGFGTRMCVLVFCASQVVTFVR